MGSRAAWMDELDAATRAAPDPRTIWPGLDRAPDHEGGSFPRHLERTGLLLRMWGQRPAVQEAGRHHALYKDRAGGVAFVEADDHALRDKIGEEADDLVRLWCRVDRPRLRNLVGAHLDGADPIELPTVDGGTVEVRPQQYVDLVHMQLANLAEAKTKRPEPFVLDRWLQDLRPVLCAEAQAVLDAHRPVTPRRSPLRVGVSRALRRVGLR